MKKIILAILMMAALVITSCGGEVPELLAFIDLNDTETNYGGAEIIISSEGNLSNEKDTAWNYLLMFDLNSMYGEALRSREAEIEQSIGVKIDYHNIPDVDSVKLFLMAGDYFCDIVNYTSFGGMQNFAKAGVLMPMTGFDAIDLSETWKYGGANVLEGAMINSVPYAVQPVSWPNYEPIECTSIVFNTQIMRTNNITNPHEFWENKNWTWANFEQVYLKDLDLSSEDLYNCSFSEYMLYYGLAYSNDLQWVTVGNDGNYVANAKPTALYEALETGSNWVRDYSDKIDFYADYWSYETFSQEDAFMTLSSADLPGIIQFECNIMPFPCGPSCEYGIWGQAIQRISGFGIPTSSNEPEVAAHVMSLLFEPFDEYIGDRESYYKQFIFNTETDVDIYLSLIENVRYDYTFNGGQDLFRSVNNNFTAAIRSGKPAAEAVEAFSSQIMTIIEECIYENYDYMYKNYYSTREGK